MVLWYSEKAENTNRWSDLVQINALEGFEKDNKN